jgi:hypothetical protein
MGRTIPSFRIALGMEKEDWKPFRNALDKKDRKEFDDMFDIPRFYISACSNSVQYVRLHPIMMSILLYHYKQLTKCINDVEQIESIVNNKYGKRLTTTIKEKGEEVKQREEKLKVVDPSGQNGNENSNINGVAAAAVVVPRQEENSKRKTTTRKKKLRTAMKQDLNLDTYFDNNKIVES